MPRTSIYQHFLIKYRLFYNFIISVWSYKYPHRDIKRGLIAKVVVYKLDRISRSILAFANMMELFQQYNVEFVSSTEKFDSCV